MLDRAFHIGLDRAWFDGLGFCVMEDQVLHPACQKVSPALSSILYAAYLRKVLVQVC